MAVSVYGAVYIALAKDLGLPMITADKKLYEKAGGLKCIELLG